MAQLLDYIDRKQLKPSELRVLELMKGGEWHTARQVRLAAGPGGGIEASEGLRRMRQLRKCGYLIEARRIGGGSFEYRLTNGKDGDQ